MKKSEMVKALQNRFCTSDVDAIADLADEIIDFLVEQGMQPPQREVKGGHLVPAEDGQEAMLTYSIVVNEWEPEDETQ